MKKYLRIKAPYEDFSETFKVQSGVIRVVVKGLPKEQRQVLEARFSNTLVAKFIDMCESHVKTFYEALKTNGVIPAEVKEKDDART